jgi:hypothetical protein
MAYPDGSPVLTSDGEELLFAVARRGGIDDRTHREFESEGWPVERFARARAELEGRELIEVGEPKDLSDLGYTHRASPKLFALTAVLRSRNPLQKAKDRAQQLTKGVGVMIEDVADRYAAGNIPAAAPPDSPLQQAPAFAPGAAPGQPAEPFRSELPEALLNTVGGYGVVLLKGALIGGAVTQGTRGALNKAGWQDSFIQEQARYLTDLGYLRDPTPDEQRMGILHAFTDHGFETAQQLVAARDPKHRTFGTHPLRPAAPTVAARASVPVPQVQRPVTGTRVTASARVPVPGTARSSAEPPRPGVGAPGGFDAAAVTAAAAEVDRGAPAQRLFDALCVEPRGAAAWLDGSHHQPAGDRRSVLATLAPRKIELMMDLAGRMSAEPGRKADLEPLAVTAGMLGTKSKSELPPI